MSRETVRADSPLPITHHPPPSLSGASAKGSFIWNLAPMVAFDRRSAFRRGRQRCGSPGRVRFRAPRTQVHERSDRRDAGRAWRDTRPLVGNSHHCPTPAPADSTSTSTTTAAPSGELDGVGEHVLQGLPDPVRVHCKDHVPTGDIDPDRHGVYREGRAGLPHEVDEVHWLPVERKQALLQPAAIQEIGDEGDHAIDRPPPPRRPADRVVGLRDGLAAATDQYGP